MSTSARGNSAHPWVQPILVSKTGSHAATIRAAAQASIAVWSKPHGGSPFPSSNYEAWLAGPFTKTVRRASEAQMSGLLQFWAKENHVPYAAFEVEDSVAVAFPPMRYVDMPKQIAKFQVHGTDFARTDTVPSTGTPVIAYVDETLSTGKAAAAAAHAVWAWALARERSGNAADVDVMQAWHDAGFGVEVRLVPSGALAELAGTAGAYPIFDAGLTEVDPNTLTAVAMTV